jgi:hypothetical protein
MNDRPLSRFLLTVTALLGLAVAGCGSDSVQVAPVSGTVTMNGDPLPGATVIFRPKTTQDDSEAKGAAESFGKTNQDGHYELEGVLTGEKGAVVGLNQVKITLDAYEDILPSYDEDGRDRRGPNPIPANYNKSTTLEFDVPPEGSQKADFDLKNPDFKVPEVKGLPNQEDA